MEEKLKFPVVAHHRIIVEVSRRNDAVAKSLFDGFNLVEPFAVGHLSSGGKYVVYNLSVRLADRAEMARVDEAIKAVPGVKMCL